MSSEITLLSTFRVTLGIVGISFEEGWGAQRDPSPLQQVQLKQYGEFPGNHPTHCNAKDLNLSVIVVNIVIIVP